MAEVPRDIEERSIGELVAMATRDVSSLLRSEVELAKLELKSDAKKAALGGTLFVVAGAIACIVVILLSISLAYGLVALGVIAWLAFLIVAILYVVLAVALCGVGYLRMRKMTGLKRTLRTTKDDLAMLKRGEREDQTPGDATEVIPAASARAIKDAR